LKPQRNKQEEDELIEKLKRDKSLRIYVKEKDKV